MKKQGIYKITSPSGKVYIGQSINIFKRWREHKNYVGVGPKLLNSYEKYGWENHKKEIIEECNIEQLSIRETFWKQYYLNQVDGEWDRVLFCGLHDLGTFGEWPSYLKEKHKEIFKGRKILWKAGRNTGWKMSEEDKNKRRVPKTEEVKIKMRKPRSDKGKENMKVPKPNLQKPIYQYDLKENFIREFKSITEAYLFLGKTTNSSAITCCLKKRQKTAYGFIWKEEKF